MDIIKISGIAVAGAMFSLVIKKEKPELAVAVALVTGVVLTGYILGTLGQVIEMVREIVEKSGVDIKYFTVIVKITAVSYICEITCELCRDMGENAIAVKAELIGKIFIMYMSMPLIKNFLEVCINAVNMV